MAARRRKSRTRGKRKPARKKGARRKPAAKQAVRRKPASVRRKGARRAASRTKLRAKKPARRPRRAARKSARPTSARPKSRPKRVAAPALARPAGAERRLVSGAAVEVGVVSHYFPRAEAAVVVLSRPIHRGDTIHVRGTTTDFVQTVEKLVLDGAPVSEGAPPQELGVELAQRARPGDRLYRVSW